MSTSIILPCLNEAQNLKKLLPLLKENQPDAEIIIVDDGSTDDSVKIAEEYAVRVVRHPYRIGNGAAIKTGVRVAKGDVLVLMDADGQHDPKDIDKLVSTLSEGYEMVVGARENHSQANFWRFCANMIYNKIGSWMVEHPIMDLTSGFRAVKANKFRKFLFLLPNHFSYPTTITMAFFRAGYAVKYVPIIAHKRMGKSHIKIFRDGIRFFLIIFKVGTLYAPLKLFGTLSIFFFSLGIYYYTYTFLTSGRFTNMGVVLFITSMLVFLIGLVSEQITQLLYSRK